MDQNTRKRKERSDKGTTRGCRWTDSYHTFRFRLADDLYQYAQEHKGATSMNKFLNDAIRTAFQK